MRRKTHEEYVAELAIKNPTIEVVEKYVNAKTKIMHHCLIHDVYWEIAPFNVLRGNGCEKCRIEKIQKDHRKTHEEYVKELAIKNPNIIVIDKYIDAKTKILHKCLMHDYEWMAAPNNVLKDKGCPMCKSESIHNKLSKGHDKYIKELKNINPDIIPLEEYVNMNTPIKHLCLKCGYEWCAQPSNILYGYQCPRCSAQRFRRNHEDYVEELKIINPDIEVVGIYINARSGVLHRCRICGNEWNALPCNILNGSGCPQCQESNGERSVRQWLGRQSINYESQKKFSNCKDKNLLSFDFYLPDYNVCIEYQGGQHYFPVAKFGGQEQFENQIRRDNIKKEYCKQNNIGLLCIKYDEDIDEALTNFLFI